MRYELSRNALLVSLAVSLAACGGGGSGVGSAPPVAGGPGPAPAPAPTPTPPAPTPVTVTSNQPLTTASAWIDGWGSVERDTLKVEYSAPDGLYTLLYPTGSVTPATSLFTYTSMGSWYQGGPMGAIEGVFAYGPATAAADIPRSGTAAYRGDIRGQTNGYSVGTDESVGPILAVTGRVSLNFDFGAGTLTGSMEPFIAMQSEAASLGTYTFRDTIYSAGETSFSGEFVVPGSSAPSAFSGSFTGPQGAELLSSWEAPFKNPATGTWQAMNGVWIARRGD